MLGFVILNLFLLSNLQSLTSGIASRFAVCGIKGTIIKIEIENLKPEYFNITLPYIFNYRTVPIHDRVPNPNGRELNGWMSLSLDSFSRSHRSGMKSSGSWKYLGSRLILQLFMLIIVWKRAQRFGPLVEKSIQSFKTKQFYLLYRPRTCQRHVQIEFHSFHTKCASIYQRVATHSFYQNIFTRNSSMKSNIKPKLLHKAIMHLNYIAFNVSHFFCIYLYFILFFWPEGFWEQIALPRLLLCSPWSLGHPGVHACLTGMEETIWIRVE